MAHHMACSQALSDRTDDTSALRRQFIRIIWSTDSVGRERKCVEVSKDVPTIGRPEKDIALLGTTPCLHTIRLLLKTPCLVLMKITNALFCLSYV